MHMFMPKSTVSAIWIRSLDTSRATMNHRSRNKVKCRKQKQKLMNIDKSPMLRGIKVWNVIPQVIQRALTKVKFKTGIKTVRLTTA